MLHEQDTQNIQFEILTYLRRFPRWIKRVFVKRIIIVLTKRSKGINRWRRIQFPAVWYFRTSFNLFCWNKHWLRVNVVQKNQEIFHQKNHKRRGLKILLLSRYVSNKSLLLVGKEGATDFCLAADEIGGWDVWASWGDCILITEGINWSRRDSLL